MSERPDEKAGIEETATPVREVDERIRRRSDFYRRRLRTLVRIRRWIRRFGRGVGAIALLIVAGVVFVSQTGRGQGIMLDAALGKVRGSLSGDLSIGGIRSGTLLGGATLSGVRLVTADGRPFLTADSVVLRYSIPRALVGGPPIRSTVIYGLDLEISRYTEEQSLNLTELLARAAPGASGSRGGRSLSFGRVGIRGGRVSILGPAQGDAGRAEIVAGPNGERLRRIGFDDLDLDVEDASITPGNAIEFEARLASFSSDISIVDSPLHVREAFGQVTYGAQGVRVTDGAFRMDESLLRGELVVGPERSGDPWTFRSSFTTDGWGALSDVQWVDERIPDGRFRGAARLAARDGGVELSFDDLQVELEASEVVFDGDVRFGDVMTMHDLHVSANPVLLERLEPWLERDLPLDGWLSGVGTFSGTLADLDAEGRVTLIPTGFGGIPTTADFSGGVRRGQRAEASDLHVDLDPINYNVLESIWPDLPFAGRGYGSLDLDGRLASGLGVDAYFFHTSPEGLESHVEARGTVARDSLTGAWSTDLGVDLLPLSVGVLDQLAPDLQLGGSIAGSVGLVGPVDSLDVDADLMAGSGHLRLRGTVNGTDPASRYRLDAVADSLPVATVVGRFPDLTSWSGSVFVQGSGFRPDSMDVTASIRSGSSLLGPVRVDTAAVDARVERGILITDSLRAVVGGVNVTGRGRLGLFEGSWGSSQLDFDGASLVGLRSLLMGVSDSVRVRDDLTELDKEFLRLQGIDPDTLPTAMDVRLDGSVEGSASVSGWIGDLDLGMIVDVVDGRYQNNEVDTVRIGFTATDLPATTGAWQIGASARGIRLEDRAFERGGFEADMFQRSGTGRIEIVRRPGEQYRALGSFALDSVGGEIELDDASVQVDEDRWVLQQVSGIHWDAAGLAIDSLEVEREGPDPMHMLVDGLLARGGRSDFRVSVDGLHVEQVLHVLQIEDVSMGGHLDLELQVGGTAEAPRINGSFDVLGARYGALELTRVQGTLDYADRLARFDVEGWDRVRSVLKTSGEFPVDMSLSEVENRIVDAPMDIAVSADSLDAAIALSYLSTLEGVVGTVSGDVRIRGTPDSPEPEGTITLSDGAWSIDAIGVRHTGVGGQLTLRPDRTVDVNLGATGPGRSDVTGTVTLEPFSDPQLDLEFDFTRFQAVARPDIEGLVSGSFTLTGNYTRPVASGALTVDVGTIYVDELQRAAGVVDLSDPFLLDEGLAVDTTALVTQPLFAGLRNPFFDNLRVDVDLSVPRGSWLRSLDTNVELSGDLLVRYDRSAGDFVLIGELEAVRGSHRVLGRSFELDGGRVVFIGRPGMNPDLDIQASTLIRRPDESPFRVQAQVGGTLVQPIVTLTTEETGLAEEDLVSYLIFGQPSGALGVRAGAQLGQTLGATAPFIQGGLTYLGGSFANQFGTAVAQELSLDYVSVQQGASASTMGATSYFGDPQIELGRYVGDDLFVIMVLRPFKTGAQDQNTVAGVRVEWALTDELNVEGFIEDRFLRSSSALLGSGGSLDQNQKILGVFLFREWGFGMKDDGDPPRPQGFQE